MPSSPDGHRLAQHRRRSRARRPGACTARAASSLSGIRQAARTAPDGCALPGANATPRPPAPRIRSPPSGLEKFPEPAELVTETAGVKAELSQLRGVQPAARDGWPPAGRSAAWIPCGPQAVPKENTRNRRADHLRTGGRSGSRCVESDNGCRHRRGMRDWLAVFAEPGKVQLDGLPHLGQDCVAGHGVLRSSPACLRTLRSVPGGNSALSLPLLSPAGFQWVRELAVGSHGSDQV
jgi:hypothetical protein